MPTGQHLCHVIFVSEILYQNLPLTPLPPGTFDDFLARGWRMLGDCLLRHNSAVIDGQRYWTIPLRIRLEGFELSKSQQKLLRRHRRRFSVKVQRIQLTPEKQGIFLRHCSRFVIQQNNESVHEFIGPQAADLPVPGYEIEVRDSAANNRLVACSYFHLGQVGVCGTYCFFEPEYRHHSLGNFTMLLELELAQRLGKQFYYPGYVHSVASQFDYKLNFNNLEEMDWATERWYPRARVETRQRLV